MSHCLIIIRKDQYQYMKTEITVVGQDVSRVELDFVLTVQF